MFLPVDRCPNIRPPTRLSQSCLSRDSSPLFSAPQGFTPALLCSLPLPGSCQAGSPPRTGKLVHVPKAFASQQQVCLLESPDLSFQTECLANSSDATSSETSFWKFWAMVDVSFILSTTYQRQCAIQPQSFI